MLVVPVRCGFHSISICHTEWNFMSNFIFIAPNHNLTSGGFTICTLSSDPPGSVQSNKAPKSQHIQITHSCGYLAAGRFWCHELHHVHKSGLNSPSGFKKSAVYTRRSGRSLPSGLLARKIQWRLILTQTIIITLNLSK